MRISDWSSDVCSSDLLLQGLGLGLGDLLDRSLLATRQGLFQIFGGLAAQQLGLVLGVGQQILGLLGGIALLALVFGQRLLRSEEHTSELQSLMRSQYAVFCLKKKTQIAHNTNFN